MGECGVCVGSADYDGSPEFHSVAVSVARKPHRCEECREIIAPGMRYQRIAGKFDGDFFSVKTCLVCAEIRDTFTCGALNYGEFWQEMREYGFEQMTTGCLEKLETAAAKKALLDRWNKWRFPEC